MRPIRNAWPKPCVASSGFIAKYMGDGVLVYFGYPQAHEDDAERAVRAGLELVAAVAALRSRVTLQARVGIATGLVVVGDLIGIGRGAGARHRRRNAEPRSAPAGHRRPGEVVCRQPRESFSATFSNCGISARTTSRVLPRRCVHVAALRASAVESRFEALQCRPHDGAGRAATKKSDADAARLVRRPGTGDGQARAAVGRGRHRQVAADGRADGASSEASRRTKSCAISVRRSARTARFFLHQPDGTRCRLRARGHAAGDGSTSSMRGSTQTATPRAGRRAVCRDALASERWSLSRARAAGAAAAAAARWMRSSAQIDALARSGPLLMIFEDAALDRSDESRSCSTRSSIALRSAGAARS